jgi:hypothetical protein
VTKRSLAIDEFAHDGFIVRDVTRDNRRIRGFAPLSRLLESRRFQRGLVFEERSLSFDEAFLQLPQGVTLDGYFQCERYFETVSDSVKREITTLRRPSAWYLHEIEKPIRGSEVVAVHLRLGDYLQPQNAAFHGVLQENYYRSALKALDRQGSVNEVMVFTDDVLAAERLTQSWGFNTTVVRPHQASSSLESLLLMSRYRRLVIANSSFSWWAAWLASRASGTAVVAPDPWFRDSALDGSNIVPSGWVRLEHRWVEG